MTGETSRPRMVSAVIGTALMLATSAVAQPMPQSKLQFVPFDQSPFPYSGPVPDKDVAFLDVTNVERRGHTSPRGGIYWQLSLIHISEPTRP